MSRQRAWLARLEAASRPAPHPDALAHLLSLTGEEAQAGPLGQIAADLGASRLPAAGVFERVRPLFRHDVHAFAVSQLLVKA